MTKRSSPFENAPAWRYIRRAREIWRVEGPRALARMLISRLGILRKRLTSPRPHAHPQSAYPRLAGEFRFSPTWQILFVAHNAHKGGAQAALLGTVSWFRAHTALSLKVLFLEGGALLPQFAELAETLVLAELPAPVRGAEAGLTAALLDFCGGRPDLIYGNTAAVGQVYPWLQTLRIPIITHIYEMEMSIRRYAVGAIGPVLEYSNHFITPSDAVSQNLIRNHHVDPARITRVWGSVPTEPPVEYTSPGEKDRRKKELGLATDRILIMGSGAGMPFRKGADLFIELGEILRLKDGPKCRLYWIGGFEYEESDPEHGRWADHLQRLNRDDLAASITFLGFKDNLNDYLRMADIFVLPSREDPLPLVALQAASFGVPVVCFADAGGTPELVGRDAGYVVPLGDAGAMAEAILHLIRDPELRSAMGKCAAAKFLDYFTIERTIPTALAACRRLARKKPAVSVIVPNYNHAVYLEARLDSIFGQSFQDFEVILLDDVSTDDSLQILEKYAHLGDVRIVRNEQNSGSAFKQWLKGIDLARADLIWIAESDDRCEPVFLETLLPAFEDPQLRLAYAGSQVIDSDGQPIGDYTKTDYLRSLSITKWETDYQAAAPQEINDGLGVKNTILNISSVVFRKFELPAETRRMLESMHIAGDWYFIVHAIQGGSIRYFSARLNSHRRHSRSVIARAVSDKNIQDFFGEYHQVQKYIAQNYRLTEGFKEKWETYLRELWQDFAAENPTGSLNDYYPFDEMSREISLASQPGLKSRAD